MKNILFLSAFVFILFVLPVVLHAEDIDPGIMAPVQAAKEYVAKKYNYDINDLTVSDTLIGRIGAHIDINHGYETERVILRYNDAEQRWEAEDSEPLHQY